MRTAAILAFALLAGCVTVQTARLGTGVIRPAVTQDKVAIYRTAEQVPDQYEEVALMSAAGDYNYTSEEQMFRKLREEAAKLGANGVILNSITEPTTGAKVANWLIGVPADRQGKAIAIFVRDQSAPATTNTKP